jgi:hypothetical protein
MRVLYLTIILIPLFGIAQNEKSEQLTAEFKIDLYDGAAPYSHIDFNNDEEMFQFAIVADRTGGHRPGIFMDAVNKLNLLQPEFVMSVGDLIEGYSIDTVELNRQWDEFDHHISKLQMPFFYVPGNHDLTNRVMEELYLSRRAKTYYHFVYKNVLFLALNSEDQLRGAGRGSISDDQFEYIKSTLDKNQEVRWTLIFMHQPLWHQKETNRWAEVELLLKGREHTVFAGHEHRYGKEDRNEGRYFSLGTTGGGSRLRGVNLGEFDQMVWVTMTEHGPVNANIFLDGITDEDIVTKSQIDWIEEITNKNPIEIEPVVKEDIQFFIGGGMIIITNDRDVPMKVRFEEENSEDLTGMVETKSLIVPSHSVKKLKYSLRCRNDQFEMPFGLTAFVSYLDEAEQPGREMPFKYKIKPIQKRIIPKIDAPLVIDGNARDWGSLRYHLEKDEDFEASFDLRYDDDFLYFAMSVKDSEVKSFGEGAAWTQDNIGFGFSAEPFLKSVMNTGRGYYSNTFFVMVTPETPDVPSVYTRELPEGSSVKCTVKPYGYFGEMAIPLSNLETFQGADWRTIRVGVAVDDFDGETGKRHWWLADWRDPNSNYIGSGMFWRAFR